MASTETLAGERPVGRGEPAGEPRPIVVERLPQLDAPSLAALNGLVADSHWNQNADDWALFHQAGTIHVVRREGRIVASGAVLPMGAAGRGETPVSWISMILVTPGARARGLGRAVFARCLREVQESGRIPMLDATPAGEALYRQFGFEPLWRLTRWRREARPATARALSSTAPQLETFVALDRHALGFERPQLLAHFLGRSGTRCLRQADALALVREGRTAHHIGPLLSAHESAAAAALTRAVASLDGAVYVDVPDDRPLMRAALQAAGFEPQRGFARMARIAPGQVLPAGQTALLHAIAGPEFA